MTITISVSRSGSGWSFSGSTDDKGNLVVRGKGATTIVFQPATGEAWTFQSPYIQFGVGGPPKNQDSVPGVLNVTGPTATSITVVDSNNQGKGTAAFYAYSLHTTYEDGTVIDPMIVNDGG